MPEPTRFRVIDFKPVVLRMPFSEAMMACRLAGRLQLLRVHAYQAEWGAGYSVEFGHRFIFNQPTNRYDYSGRQATLTELLQDLTNVEWSSQGYTYSEVGLFRDGEGLYGYLPDLNEDPKRLQELAAELEESIRVIFHNAEAQQVTVKQGD